MSETTKNLTTVENDAAEVAENAQDTGVVTVILSRPLEYEGKTYKELSFDFDSLTGADDLAIEKECQASGSSVFVPALSGDYLIRMCARASVEKIGHDALLFVSLKDSSRIKTEARNFLLRSE